jgi:hypothetical protein
MHTGKEEMGSKGVREEGVGVGAGKDVKDVYFTGSSTMIEPEYIEPKRAQQAHASFPPSVSFLLFIFSSYFTGSSTMPEPERAQQAHTAVPPPFSFLFSFFLYLMKPNRP